jgi:hypothetical protein
MTIDTGRTEDLAGAENDELRMKRIGCGERGFLQLLRDARSCTRMDRAFDELMKQFSASFPVKLQMN